MSPKRLFRSIPAVHTNLLGENHVAEVVLSLVVFAGTTVGMMLGHLDRSAGLEIDLLTAVFCANVAILKQHFTKIARTLCDRDQAVRHAGLQVTDTLAALDGELKVHAKVALRRACEQIERIGQGIVQLDPREYYRTLRGTLDKSRRGSHVYAVSSIDAMRWKEDRNQLRWLEDNVAGVRRGVNLRRVFVLKKAQMASSQGDTIRQLIAEQRKCNIDVHAVWLEDIMHEDPQLRDDFVLFWDAERAFRDHHDPEESTRVLSAEMIMPPSLLLGEYRLAFEKLRDFWLDPSELDNTVRVGASK